jgi:cytochrome c oxidase subunit IV
MEQSNAKDKEIKRLNLALLAAAGVAFLVAVWTAISDQMRGGTDDLFLILVCLLLAALFAISPLMWAKQNGLFAAGVDEEEPAPAHDIEEHHGGANRQNIIIWGGLLGLTAIEVFLAYIHLHAALMLTILMLLSIVKAALIVAYFMHLKFERLSLVMTIVPTLIVLFLLFGIFFPDSRRAHDLRPAMEVQQQPAEHESSADEEER